LIGNEIRGVLDADSSELWDLFATKDPFSRRVLLPRLAQRGALVL
jgi:hypothetical protein